MPLFKANYKDPADNRTYSVCVVAVDLKIKKALILHGQRELITVRIDELTWDKWFD